MCDVGQRIAGTQFYNNMVASNLELSIDPLKKLIDEVKPFKPAIAITSTEPLLYKDLREFSRYVKENGLDLQITTNGYLLNEFADDFVDIGVDIISVSLDGPPAVHNLIRGRPDSFQRAIDGIKRINTIKKQKNKIFPRIRINYSISNYNYSVLVDFINLFHDIDVDSITFSHLNFITPEMALRHNAEFGNECVATPSCVSELNLFEIDTEILWNEISVINSRYQNCHFVPEMNKSQMSNYYSRPDLFIGDHSRCLVPWSVAQIFANGDLGITTRCFNLKIGNIHNAAFLEVWNGEPMKKFRRLLRKNKAFPACSRCCGVF
jgi:MoaA/NifB/PqqE/SkfB family radical SAM enzyme